MNHKEFYIAVYDRLEVLYPGKSFGIYWKGRVFNAFVGDTDYQIFIPLSALQHPEVAEEYISHCLSYFEKNA